MVPKLLYLPFSQLTYGRYAHKIDYSVKVRTSAGSGLRPPGGITGVPAISYRFPPFLVSRAAIFHFIGEDKSSVAMMMTHFFRFDLL